jgi:AcrR family transcriptional regulator
MEGSMSATSSAGSPAAPRKRGRPSTRDDSCRRILDAAEQLFAEEDPHRVSMVAISKHSGVPRSTVYECYPSREAILLGVISRNAARTAQSQAQGMAAGMDWGQTFELAMGDGSYHRALLRALMGGVDAGRLSGVTREIEATLRYFARPLPAQDGFDPRLVTAALVTLTVGWQVMESFTLSAVGLGDEDVHEMRAEIARLMVGMMALATNPDAASEA